MNLFRLRHVSETGYLRKGQTSFQTEPIPTPAAVGNESVKTAEIRRHRTNRRRGMSRDRVGATSVEFALCVPIVFTVLFAGYELAHANLVQHATESAAYEAARVGIVPGASPAQLRNAASGILNSIGVNDFDLQVDTGRNPDGTETIEVEIVVDFVQTSTALRFFPWSPRMRGRCELTREFF